MWKQILGVLIMTQTAAMSCRYNILNLEVENYSNKIWIGQKISKKMIAEGLNFVDDVKTVDERFRKNSFNEYCEKIKNTYENENLKKFINKSEAIYQKDPKEERKVALFMLVENVTEKFAEAFKRLERKKELEKKSQNKIYNNTESLFKIFINSDKNLKTNN